MKKNRKIILTAVSACLIISAASLFPAHHVYGGIYHNKLNVALYVNGAEKSLDGGEIKFYSNAGEIVPSVPDDIKTFVSNDKGKDIVKFLKGFYGRNSFEFIIPPEKTGLPYDVTVDVGRFNDNYWHRNEYDISIYLDTNEDMTADIQLSQTINYYDEAQSRQTIRGENTKTVNADDSTVSLELF